MGVQRLYAREDCRKLMGDSWRRSDIVQEISFGYCVKRLWEIKLESDRWYSLYVYIDTLELIFEIPEIYWNFHLSTQEILMEDDYINVRYSS